MLKRVQLLAVLFLENYNASVVSFTQHFYTGVFNIVEMKRSGSLGSNQVLNKSFDGYLLNRFTARIFHQSHVKTPSFIIEIFETVVKLKNKYNQFTRCRIYLQIEIHAQVVLSRGLVILVQKLSPLVEPFMKLYSKRTYFKPYALAC